MSDFQLFKLQIVDALGLAKDAVHIYAGLAVFLGAALLFRRSLRDWLPFAAVLAAALLGELWDIYDSVAGNDPVRWDKSWHDVWNTILTPSLLFLLARYTRLLKR
jgi:cell shape-determining protein MreD